MTDFDASNGNAIFKKSVGHFKPTRVADIYQVISVLTQDAFRVTELCDVLDVSRSAYYDWKTGKPNLYQQQDQKLQPMITDIFQQHRRRYGARRIAHELKEQSVSCSRSKIRKIMGQMGLVAIQPGVALPRELQPMITDIFQQHRRRYGARRIAHELKEQSVSCSRSKIRKIMGQMGLVAIQPGVALPRVIDW